MHKPYVKREITINSAKQYSNMFSPHTVPFKVRAFCVGGEDGILAYWLDPASGLIFQAAGDDGAWWVTGFFHKDWLTPVLHTLGYLNQEMTK